MRTALLILALALPASAAQLEGWRPAPERPASAAWAGALGSALPVAASLDSSLAPFGSLDFTRAFARAALGPLVRQLEREPLEAQAELRVALAGFAALPAERRSAVLSRLSTARAFAEDALAGKLRDGANLAASGEIHPAELVSLIDEYEAYAIYGPRAAAALDAAKLVVRAKVAIALIRPFDERRDAAVPGGEARISQTLAAPSASAPGRMPSPPAPKKRSNLALRAATAALLVPSVVGLVHLGGLAFTGFVGALAALCALEYSSLMTKGGRPVSKLLTVGGAAALALFPSAATVTAVVALAAASEVFRKDHSLERLAFTAAGAALLGLGLAPLIALRALTPYGQALALLAFVSAWFSDTLAMLVGKKLGRRKLAPVLSPNKTWEGSLGGLAGALAAGALFHAFGGLPWALALGAAALVGTVGQVSGLMNSMIKRLNGAKDSGTLLPGHGGFLDRFDTLLLASAAVYALTIALR